VRPSMLNDLASAMKAIVSQRLLRRIDGGRVPAVEVMVNSRLIAELIEKGDFFGVREALEKSMAKESQTFEADLARLVVDGAVTRDEALSNADSPTNLMWRLDNDVSLRAPKGAAAEAPPPEVSAGPSFTDFTLDVKT
jgi:twitching motility protein PilU